MKNLYMAIFTVILISVPVTDCISNDNNLVPDADRQYEYAEYRYSKKDYAGAASEYKRFLYFFPGDKRAGYAEFKTGKSLFHMKKYNEAAAIFQKLSSSPEQGPLYIESCFMLKRTYINMGNPGHAETVMQNLLIATEDKDLKDRIYSSLAWIYLRRAENMETHALETADRHITEISEKKSSYKKKMKKGIKAVKDQDEKNPLLAGIASIIPGGGLVYCERYREGIISFFLNTAIILAARNSFRDGNDPLGGIILFVGTGFYTGNIYGAVSGAHKYNRFKRREIIRNILDPELSVSPDRELISFQMRF